MRRGLHLPRGSSLRSRDGGRCLSRDAEAAGGEACVGFAAVREGQGPGGCKGLFGAGGLSRCSRRSISARRHGLPAARATYAKFLCGSWTPSVYWSGALYVELESKTQVSKVASWELLTSEGTYSSSPFLLTNHPICCNHPQFIQTQSREHNGQVTRHEAPVQCCTK